LLDDTYNLPHTSTKSQRYKILKYRNNIWWSTT